MSFDIRLQFLMLLACSSIIPFIGENEIFWLVGVALLFLICQGLWRLCLYWQVSYTLLLLVYFAITNYLGVSFFWSWIGIFLSIGIMLGPVLMIASSLAVVPSGKLIASLQMLKIPNSLIVTMTVALRFFPILRMEAKIINENAMIRGISLKQVSNWRHGMLLYEYAIVPLLMRTIKLGDDLSASATTRGIDAPVKKSSMYQIRFSIFDLLAVLLIVLCICTPFLNRLVG